MNIENEVDVTPKEAINILKHFTQDPFLEENDPDLAKGINLIYQNLLTTSFEIVTPTVETVAQDNNAEQEGEEPPAETHHRRRRHSKKSNY